MPLYYLLSDNTTYTSEQIILLFGFDPTTTDIAILNDRGFYPVNETTTTADPFLYEATPSYAVAGQYADQTWVYTARPLSIAKVNGTTQVTNNANSEVSTIVSVSGYSAETLAAAGAELEGARPAIYQTVIAEQQVVTDNLAVQVAAIAAATTVDEINNVVNPPTGILSTGRGGDGDGPLDLNNSFYTEFNSVSLTEAETELYVPGTSTVITYGAVVPNGFTSNGNCFTTGDYRVQIREVATGMVISEFVCPLAVEHNEDIPF
jgi:hypothetical protein